MSPLVMTNIANWKITMNIVFKKKKNYFYGHFSVATLNYQRVYDMYIYILVYINYIYNYKYMYIVASQFL